MQLWECPYCEWQVEQPEGTADVWHKCPARGYDKRHLKLLQPA